MALEAARGETQGGGWGVEAAASFQDTRAGLLSGSRIRMRRKETLGVRAERCSGPPASLVPIAEMPLLGAGNLCFQWFSLTKGRGGLLYPYSVPVQAAVEGGWGTLRTCGNA